MASALQRAGVPSAAGTRLLVIDDDPAALSLMQATLGTIGVEAVCRRDGRQALDEIDRIRPDALVLDLTMPGFDGFQVLQALRAMPAWQHLPVFVWTAMSLPPSDLASLARSARGIVAKGDGDLATLREALRRGAHRPRSPTTARTPRVLVVDDNAMNEQMVRFLLEADGIDLASAGDVETALALADDFAPDLILMDIQLPGIDGLQGTRRLKAQPALRHIVVVALTAYAMKGDEAKILAAGCEGYLSKPIDVTCFVTQVRAHLPAPRLPGAT